MHRLQLILDPGKTSPQFTSLTVPSTDWGKMRITFKKNNQTLLLWLVCLRVLWFA